ncbi:hypothetical protein DL89DRAFT_269322 [Linderina pennispora]|uniref:Uncharacterized protein n=1 Tax=Linderina pennispora TaxID=61395 RepID=A0A1Y1W302_9FUNG|nr:uncharacterized protein DL89DRAFT_269322 [Linderina pennispora]ORX67524.1 hypothetical protein DL89DRAFT_269322 [Linderina pennispora]
MLQFLDSIESEVYALTKFESFLSFNNLRTVFFYANNETTSELHAAQGARRSLLSDSAAWTSQTLNLPGYCESQSDIHYCDIESANFSPSTWPSDLVPVCDFAHPDKATGMIKLANTHVRANLYLLNVNHGVTDGYGYFEFFNCWADQTRAMVAGVPAETTRFCFDRSAIRQYLPNERLPLEDTLFRAYTRKLLIADKLVGLPPNTRGKLLSYIERKTPNRGHLFRISRDKLDDLRSQVLACMPPGSRVSSNDLLTAIGSKRRAKAKNPGWLSRLTKAKARIEGEHCVSVACDLRGRLGMTDMNYFGNPALDPITPQTLADTVGQIRDTLSNVTPPYIGSFIDLLESDDFSTGALIATMMKYKLVTITTNMSQARMYNADFGSGVQAFSTSHPTYPAANFLILPSPPPSKDFLVNFTTSASEMKSILKNEFWSDFASLVY